MFEYDHIDDEIPDFDNSDDGSTLRESVETVLAREALGAALTPQTRRTLKRRPGVFIVHVPHVDWAEMIATSVRGMNKAPAIKIVTERVRKAGMFSRVGGDALTFVQQGRSVLYVCPDPDALLDEAVLTAADLTIVIPPLTAPLLRKVIRRVSGGVARGVTAEMARLTLPVIMTLVRQDLNAGTCVQNLRRALARKANAAASIVPHIAKLPLTDAMRDWADQTMADLTAVKNGAVPPSQLRFGILEGPPGTGKSLIAESLARSAGWSFVPINVGKLFTSGDGALGGVAKNLSAFFAQLVAQQPAIGFMDEIDAFPNRATMDNRGRDWWTPVINLFLTEIDAARKAGKPIMLLGATNHYERLDSALTRPGRLHQRIAVLPPQTEAEVVALVRYYLGDDLPACDLQRLGRVGRGATPAMVEEWLKQARSDARRQNRPLALTDIMAQVLPQDDRDPADIFAIALHEIGHAVVARRLGQQVDSVSIVPEGDSGGRTWTRASTIVPTWTTLRDRVTVMLGGRAADVALGAGPNAGAETDLASATELLVAACQRQGLRDTLIVTTGPIVTSDTLKAVDAELHRLLARAVAIIEEHSALVLHLTARLIEERVLTGEEVAQVLDAVSLKTEIGDRPHATVPSARRAAPGGS